LKWIHPFHWLIYPAVYLAYALLRGEFSGFHAYPFMNTAELGYKSVLFNAGRIMLVFIAAGFTLVGIDKLLSRSKSRVLS